MAWKLWETIRRLQEEGRALLDDSRMASQDQDRLHPFKRFLHFWVLVGRSFIKNRCVVRATALAYTTLLSLVPLLAVGLGVTTSLLKTETSKTRDLIERVIDNLAPQLGPMTVTVRTPVRVESPPSANQESAAVPEVANPDGPANDPKTRQEVAEAVAEDAREEVIDTIMSFIDNINSAGLGAIGTGTLILVAVGLLSTIEATFNDIWGVHRGRRWFSRIVQYWAAITLGPLILVFATTFAVGTQFEAFRDKVLGLGGPEVAKLGGLLFGMFTTLLPLLLVTVAFSLLYQLMPATSVDWRAAVVGGFVGGLLWWLNGKLSVVFAAKVVSASRIYGSLGVLPVFLTGLYLSWLILLFGCQVSYAYQNRRAYLEEKQAEVLSPSGREYIALRLMAVVGERFHRGQPPPSACDLAVGLGVSSQLICQLTEQLRGAKLVNEVNALSPGLVPARPLDQITCQDVMEVVQRGRDGEPATRDDEHRFSVQAAYREIRQASEAAGQHHTLLALLEAPPDARRPGPPGPSNT